MAEKWRRKNRAVALGLPGLCALLMPLLLCDPVEGSSEAWLKSEKHAEIGTEVQLPCVLKLRQCIGLHSIKWYQGNERIFVYSAEGDVTLANDDMAARMSMIVPKNNATKSYLKILNLTLEDEALYKCEVTYLAVNRECNNVQHITLNVTVQPSSVRVVDESAQQTLEDGRVLGPIIEGSTIALRCESGKGRPVPTVDWYNGDVKLKSVSSSELEEDGIGTGSGTLNLAVARSELGATFTCEVSSIALDEPLKIDIKLDVHVRPMKMDIKGVVGHVINGSKVLLQCEVQGARPPANVTWYNGTEILDKNSSRLEMQETKLTDNADGTTQTNSYIAFTTTEHDNGRKFSCAAVNSVMLKEGSKPMRETVIMEVMYPPIIRMSPENVTVNETDDFQLFCDYEANPASLVNVLWQRDGKNLTLNEEHYEGGTSELTSLLVKNASASDIGSYACILENDFGSSKSSEPIDVTVLYRPVVEVTMEPDAPLIETARLNVSLSCDVLSGNPSYLSAVRWYLDGDLLKELPDCSRNVSAGVFCDIDPSKLLLESVGRSFHGNYSCEGRNEAGWGPISPNTPVVVYYKPGPASISYEPKKVVKKEPLNITCSVDDPGRPAATSFKWYRGLMRLSEERESVFRADKVRLEYRDNYTCMAHNDAGDGDPSSTFIDISAPPAFIKKLPQLVGFVYNATNVSLECHVECSPLCDIVWLKNNRSIDFGRTRKYYVENGRLAPNRSTDDFESISSSLIWNLTAWPSGQLDRIIDNDSTFTCMSTSNGIGPGVSSTVKIEVYFPPEGLTISRSKVNVVVDNIPEPIQCSANARPDPQYRWYREGKSEIISEGPVLHFKTPFPRASRGTYVCQASNKIGSATISTYINVQYKPECQVDKEVMDGKDYVVCSAEGNPTDYSFKWSLKSDNDTIEQVPMTLAGRNYLPLDDSVSNPRTYVCVANNSIGQSSPCERHVLASVPWWMRLDGDMLVIAIATTVIVILIIIVVCVIIFLMCRRKHSKLKYSSRVVELAEREHPDGGPPSPSASSIHSTPATNGQSQQQPPAPRWPLKPGVLVHINRTHSMRSGLTISPRLNSVLSGSAGGSISSGSRLRLPPSSPTSAGTSDSTPLTGASESLAHEAEVPASMRAPVRPFKRTSKDEAAVSQVRNHRRHRHQQHNDEGVLARASRIRAMFAGSQLKDSDTFPGISRGKTAVTYKRIETRRQQQQEPEPAECSSLDLKRNRASDEHRVSHCGRNNVSRKRKKPGADPSQSANSNHMDSVSEGLSEPETKTFYENLPFHGIQSPPNKLIVGHKSASVGGSSSNSCWALHSCSAYSGSVSSGSPCSSRPASRATSLCGGCTSSGYESTSVAATLVKSKASGEAPTERSHLGPHLSEHNMPRANSPEPRCNSLKPRRRKQHQRQRHAAQFYSLRLCRRHLQQIDTGGPRHLELATATTLTRRTMTTTTMSAKTKTTTTTTRRRYQVYAIPIYRSVDGTGGCPHRSLGSLGCGATPTSSLSHATSRETIAELAPDDESERPPPVPAPRLVAKKAELAEHTYQNVPPPVFPPEQ